MLALTIAVAGRFVNDGANMRSDVKLLHPSDEYALVPRWDSGTLTQATSCSSAGLYPVSSISECAWGATVIGLEVHDYSPRLDNYMAHCYFDQGFDWRYDLKIGNDPDKAKKMECTAELLCICRKTLSPAFAAEIWFFICDIDYRLGWFLRLLLALALISSIIFCVHLVLGVCCCSEYEKLEEQ